MPPDTTRPDPVLLARAERVLRAARAAGADSCDVLASSSREFEVKVEGGRVLCLTQATRVSLGLRVFVGGRLGFATSSEASPDALDALARSAVALAREAAVDPHHGLAEPDAADAPRPAYDLELYDPAVAALSAEAKLDWAHAIEAAARDADPRVTAFRDSGIATSIGAHVLACSDGRLNHQASSDISAWCTPVARDGSERQTDFWYDTQPYLCDLTPVQQIGRMAAGRAARMLGARPVPTQRVPIVFEAPVAAGLIAGMVGALDGELVHKRASFLADKLGEQIAAPELSVVDDPWRRRGVLSAEMDGEGRRTRPKTLIERGRLQMFLYDSYTARKVGTQPTGSARRSAETLPRTGTFNIGVAAGSCSEQAMLREAPRALLVTRGLGQGLDAVTGGYSRGAGGLWLEHGEVVHAVQEVTIAGSYLDMLRDIDAVGDTVLWRGAQGAPMLRIGSMMVSGR